MAGMAEGMRGVGESARQALSSEDAAVLAATSSRTHQANILAVLKRYDTYIGQVNQKASFLMAATGLLLVTAIAQRRDVLGSTEVGLAGWINDAFYLLAGLGLFTTLGLSLAVLLPITRWGTKHGEDTSFIAYSSVAKMQLAVLRSRLASADYDFWDDLVRETHALARITATKFLIVGWASWAAVISTASFFILFLFATF